VAALIASFALVPGCGRQNGEFIGAQVPPSSSNAGGYDEFSSPQSVPGGNPGGSDGGAGHHTPDGPSFDNQDGGSSNSRQEGASSAGPQDGGSSNSAEDGGSTHGGQDGGSLKQDGGGAESHDGGDVCGLDPDPNPRSCGGGAPEDGRVLICHFP